jgi:hypothetical protein
MLSAFLKVPDTHHSHFFHGFFHGFFPLTDNPVFSIFRSTPNEFLSIKEGKLNRNSTIAEPRSGITGIGLTLVRVQKGHKFIN